MTRMNGTLHEDQYTFMIISHSFLLRMRSMSDKFVEKMTVKHMHIACWILKATNAHLEYVIFIAFPLQKWLYEHASVSCYTYIASLAFWE